MILTSSKLVTELHELGVQIVANPRDAQFYCPEIEWLKKFGSYFSKEIARHPWIAEKFDCDDFSIRAIDRATESLVKAKNINDCGHTFCYACIEISGNIFDVKGPATHAVNFVRCTDAWYYFEPQRGQSLPLQPLLDDGSVFSIYSVWL